MKRLAGFLPPLLLLAGLVAFCLWVGHAVEADACRWRAPLVRSSQAALLEDWDAAADLLEASYDDWQQHRSFLRIVAKHDILEEAESMYRRAFVLLGRQETAEYRSELAELCRQLSSLAEQEQFSLENIL